MGWKYYGTDALRKVRFVKHEIEMPRMWEGRKVRRIKCVKIEETSRVSVLVSATTGGLGYVISFAIGASIVTISLWIIRYCYNCYMTNNLVVAYTNLPSFHLTSMWFPGGLAGTLWSVGNVASIVSVQHLGEGVGYSVIQSAMLVSGLWGIFWFREIRGASIIRKWFAAAVITVCGIFLLSREHLKM